MFNILYTFQENCLNSEVVDQIYKRNPILRYTHHPLHTPLLPLPYGDVHRSCECLTPHNYPSPLETSTRLIFGLFFCLLAERGRSYSTLQAEALKLFCTLQQLEGVADPVPIIQGLLQTAHDLRPLRDELYCQLIKQTTRPPEPGGPAHISGWRVIACMCCTFSPVSRSILKYLKFHIKRSVAVCMCVCFCVHLLS